MSSGVGFTKAYQPLPPPPPPPPPEKPPPPLPEEDPGAVAADAMAPAKLLPRLSEKREGWKESQERP
jgi:hypothetical protein